MLSRPRTEERLWENRSPPQAVCCHMLYTVAVHRPEQPWALWRQRETDREGRSCSWACRTLVQVHHIPPPARLLSRIHTDLFRNGYGVFFAKRPAPYLSAPPPLPSLPTPVTTTVMGPFDSCAERTGATDVCDSSRFRAPSRPCSRQCNTGVKDFMEHLTLLAGRLPRPLSARLEGDLRVMKEAIVVTKMLHGKYRQIWNE